MIDTSKIVERLDEAIARKQANADPSPFEPASAFTRSAYVRLFRREISDAIEALATALVELDAIEGERVTNG